MVVRRPPVYRFYMIISESVFVFVFVWGVSVAVFVHCECFSAHVGKRVLFPRRG